MMAVRVIELVIIIANPIRYAEMMVKISTPVNLYGGNNSEMLFGIANVAFILSFNFTAPTIILLGNYTVYLSSHVELQVMCCKGDNGITHLMRFALTIS